MDGENLEVQPVEQVNNTQQDNSEDLITKVSKFIENKDPSVEAAALANDGSKFNSNDLDTQINSIQDPALRAQMEGLKKSLLSGENKKYQELAELKKELQQVVNREKGWTPERIQQLANDPEFIRVSQQMLGTNSIEDDSLLSEAEKAILRDAQEAKKMTMTLQSQLQREKEDSGLKTKYYNYDPKSVDDIYNGMVDGSIRATREHLWKVVDYDKAVERAYKMGISDRQNQTNEKFNASSTNGLNVTNVSDPIKKEEGESSSSLLRRIIAKNKAAIAGR